MTFDGSMPGPMMVVHEGDYMDLTLVNPATDAMPHNIDLHSATGALGGGALTHVNPGEQVVLRSKATRPGVFIYHCVPEGMIPSENDFCACRRTRTASTRPTADTTEVMRKLIPTHMVFNGRVGSLTGKNAMTSKVGGPSCSCIRRPTATPRPHFIGGHGEHVWEAGKFNNPKDLETWFYSRWLGRRRAVHDPRTRHLRLRQPQPDRGGRTRGQRPHQGGRQVERRPHEAGVSSRPILPAKVGAAEPVAVTR
jgi:nitrite reductase (NO-forming)